MMSVQEKAMANSSSWMQNLNKEPGRASGFNVKSPILSNQGYQIAGITGPNPGLHSSATPLKEYDSQGRAGPGAAGGAGIGPPQQQEYHYTLQFDEKNHYAQPNNNLEYTPYKQ